ncbi:DUF559 domain-containing protein [Lentzea sp. CA-135723]|uniref:DUF559 domain-containing protein n=1 Tax=Lentzea sp. CA-135723 TaxID=3239950 RepID=UPI003D8C6C8F
MTGFRGGSAVGRYSSHCPPGRCAAAAEPGTSKLEQDLFTLLKVPFGGGDLDYRVGRCRADMAFRVVPTGSLDQNDNLVLVIEYDGAYWHEERKERDLAKTEWMRSCGHEVIRVREFPLKKLGEHDIEAPQRPDPLLCARLVLLHALHEFLDWYAFEETQIRVKQFLMAIGAPLERDQVKCSDCWELATKIKEVAAKRYWW